MTTSLRSLYTTGLAICLPLLGAACGPQAEARTEAPTDAPPSLRIALAPHAGSTSLDQQLRTAQAEATAHPDAPRLERLATLFITKARTSGDPGFYAQATACSDAMPTTGNGRHAAMLVRGHVRHALHDFPTAERIARELVAERGLFLDNGLLGDVLLDQGRLTEARDVYQRMLDQKPCLQSYSRAAQVRWLIGDVPGCRELLDLAASAGSRRDPESLAWVLARRAGLELQANDADAAARFADEALAVVPDYPAALAARGRAAMAKGAAAVAVESLAAAAARSPLPEHLWAHADALRAAGREAEAAAVEAELLRTGEREDPRTFAVWLATSGRDVARCLRLAKAEVALRRDAHTLDALAAAQWRTGDVEAAAATMQQALVVGVQDARLHLHAACISDARGDRVTTATHVAAAQARLAALLPSEQRQLAAIGRRQ